MIHITRTEAAWMMDELRDRAKAYKGAAGLDFPKKSGLDAAFFNLRSEQLTLSRISWKRQSKAAVNGSQSTDEGGVTNEEIQN